MHNIIELVFNEDDMLNGVDAISIVESPAIESDFIKLNSQEDLKLAKVNDEKRILMGAALIPNKLIYRKSGDQEFYIFFSKETIRQVSEAYLKRGNQSETTLEHEIKLQGLTIVESWIVEDTEKDKSRLYNLDAPLGTWCVSMKVDNDEVWNDFVKTGKVKGFSIEGNFADKMPRPKEVQEEKLSLEDEQLKEIVEELGGDYDEWVKNLEHIDQPNCGIENPDDCEACGS